MVAKKTRIVAVDDHQLLLSGLTLLLNSEPDMVVIGSATSAQKALDLVVMHQPDILLLDITLQDHSGLNLLESILHSVPQLKIIMLTMHENQEYLKRAIELGARGYVLKRALDQDLIYAIRTVMEGEMYIQPSMLKGYVAAPKIEKENLNPRDEQERRWNSLSQREKQILLLVAKGYTAKEIAAQCYLSEKTVTTYRYRGLTKLDIENKADLVKFVFEMNRLY